ncbi:MAG: Uma2 family endonuclease [Planctomycetales bacterium]|nr:Uma2 family endonuclease [Planctomycetales bacterium]
MSTAVKLTGAEFDAMVERGAFQVVGSKKIELIRGELRFMNPAGPIHDDYIEFLTRWSTQNADPSIANIRVQSGFICDDDRPEPDVLWLKPRRYGRVKPSASDILLLMEVSDSSLTNDLREKADIYARAGVAEYWVIDIPNSRLHRMTDSNGSTYRQIEIATPPSRPAPLCHPPAELDLEKLFEVR